MSSVQILAEPRTGCMTRGRLSNTLCLFADSCYYFSPLLLGKIISKTVLDSGEGAGRQVLSFAAGGNAN